MPKRDRNGETSENDGETMIPSKQRVCTEGSEEDEFDSEDEMIPVDDEVQDAPLVCWLEEGSTRLSIGELHFSNVDHLDSPEDPNGYCVVHELKALPSTETGFDYAFEGGFPFKVLLASACVALPPEMDDDDEESLVFRLDPRLHQTLIDDLLPKEDEEDPEGVYTPVPSSWNFACPSSEDSIIDGLKNWWKAGEAKTGWDLAKIPQDDSTTTRELVGSQMNVVLELYKDLCAFRPLTEEDDRDTIEERFEWRTCLCTYFAWAIPNLAGLRVLANLKQPLLEIGAGTGYWAYLLNEMGVDIKAYDLEDSHGGQKARFRHPLVQDGGVEQVSKHPDRTLVLCWPDIVGDSAHDDADRGSFGVDTLKAYRGDTFVYIGELGPGVVRAAKGWGDPFPPGGSSASAAFQEELRSNFRLVQKVTLPNWPPYNSHLFVWKRK